MEISLHRDLPLPAIRAEAKTALLISQPTYLRETNWWTFVFTGRPRPGQRAPNTSLADVNVETKKAGVPKDPAMIALKTGILGGGRPLGDRIYDATCLDPSGLFHNKNILSTRVLNVNPLFWSDAEGSNPARTAYKTAPLQPAGLRRASYISTQSSVPRSGTLCGSSLRFRARPNATSIRYPRCLTEYSSDLVEAAGFEPASETGFTLQPRRTLLAPFKKRMLSIYKAR